MQCAQKAIPQQAPAVRFLPQEFGNRCADSLGRGCIGWRDAVVLSPSFLRVLSFAFLGMSYEMTRASVAGAFD